MIRISVFIFSDFQENTYLLSDETNAAVIIDPGCYTDAEKQELKSFIAAENLTIKKALFTHCHLDHIFGARFLCTTFPGIEFLAHKNEEVFLKQSSRYSQVFAVKMEEPPALQAYLAEGDKIQVGNSFLTALHVPGHSPGSLCYYCAEQKIVFVGDTLFAGSIGRSDLPGGDYYSLIENLQQKLMTLPEDVTVYSGHGPTTTIGQEKLYNPYLKPGQF